MKCSIPEISWHNREPVLSADFQPINPTNNDFYRLATGGCDNFVLIWKLKILSDGQIDVSILAELTRHQRSVNCVKWSPDGVTLASADDDANIILWQLKTDNIPSLDEHEDGCEEKWNVLKVLRGHKEDVYDLCWSPKGDKLLSGSVDNTAIIWDITKGKNEHIIHDNNKGFIQGVAWDPRSEYVATLCSDRICRVYDKCGRRVRSRIGRGKLPVDKNSEFYDKEVKYFYDDTFKTYFRRLCFTPDGTLLLVPSGAVETDERKNAFFGTFAFTLDALASPICLLPSGKQCSIVVRCCPILFELRENGPTPLIDLPYRMIIAVATDSDVILYDTQQEAPCIHLQDIHYTRLTDLTWSIDGLVLACSSTDGFITLVTFEEGELGSVYTKGESDMEESILDVSGYKILPLDASDLNDKVKPVVEEVVKKPSFLEQWTKQAKRRSIESVEELTEAKRNKTENSNNVGAIIDMDQVPVQKLEVPELKNGEQKKRITPVLLSKKLSLTPPKLSRQVSINADKSESIESKPKKRIHPIRVGDAAAHKVNEDKAMPKLVKMQESAKVEEDKISELKTDDTKILALTTPKADNDKPTGTPNNKVKTPSSNKTSGQPNQSSEKSASSKKKRQQTPTNTLFNYLKPIPKTPSTERVIKDGNSKNEFKPQNLFGKEEKKDTPTDIIETKGDTKIKVSGLIKPKTKPAVVDLLVSDDTANELEDFVLRVEDDDVKESIEKENDVEAMDVSPDNTVRIVELKVPLKAEAKRRIPLITLSSPKNKKKPRTAK